MSVAVRDLLKQMAAENPPDSAVREFVRVCRKIALVLVKRKIAGGRLNLSGVDLSPDDLALDCIADLFSRNTEGEYTQIRVYLKGIDLERTPEPELMSHLRRLVFSRVNQGIFRVYRETDPSLSKIIRNMKISVRALDNFTLVDRFGEPTLVPVGCDPLEHLPGIGHDLLRDSLTAGAGKPATIPELMSKLFRCLREQEQFCRMLPLVQVALLFRVLYGAAESNGSAEPVAENIAAAADGAKIIAEACKHVMEEVRGKYVGSGKVSPEMLGTYFKVIEAALLHVILERDGEEVSYYTGLSNHIAGLTMDEYKRSHRSRIEYLGQLAHRRAIEELRQSF